MLLKLLRAERMKLKRSPVWLAFLLMPIIPAALGTANYIYNQGILTKEWLSLWTQHTLFTDYFFLPIMLGIYCAYIMRLDGANHNWNKVFTMPARRSAVFLAKLITAAMMLLFSMIWICALFDMDMRAVCDFGIYGGSYKSAVAHNRAVVRFRYTRRNGYCRYTDFDFDEHKELRAADRNIVRGRAVGAGISCEKLRSYMAVLADVLRNELERAAKNRRKRRLCAIHYCVHRVYRNLHRNRGGYDCEAGYFLMTRQVCSSKSHALAVFYTQYLF